jgi:hypothetical protein
MQLYTVMHNEMPTAGFAVRRRSFFSEFQAVDTIFVDDYNATTTEQNTLNILCTASKYPKGNETELYKLPRERHYATRFCVKDLFRPCN